MVRVCSVYYCLQKDEKGISFHRFPKDPERLKKWLAAIRREESWVPKREHAVCSKHFTPECFEKNGWSSQIRLSSEAIPSIFSFPSEPLKFSGKRRRLSKKHDGVITLCSNFNNEAKQVKKRTPPPFIPIQKHQEIVKQKNSKIKSLLQKNRRLSKKVDDLQSIIAQMESNKLNETFISETVYLSEDEM